MGKKSAAAVLGSHPNLRNEFLSCLKNHYKADFFLKKNEYTSSRFYTKEGDHLCSFVPTHDWKEFSFVRMDKKEVFQTSNLKAAEELFSVWLSFSVATPTLVAVNKNTGLSREITNLQQETEEEESDVVAAGIFWLLVITVFLLVWKFYY